MQLLYVFVPLALCPLFAHAKQLPCPEGYYFKSADKTCQPCNPHQPQNAELEHPCNATHDAEYRCDNRSFRSNGDHQLVCQRCTLCKEQGLGYEARPCSGAQDAVCCPYDGMTAVLTKDEACANVSTNNAEYCCLANRSMEPATLASNPTTMANQNTPTTATDEAGIALTCGRNTYADNGTNSCRHCRTCFYVDRESHRQQSCDRCFTKETTSRLVYCPARCAAQDTGLKDCVRLLLSGALVLCAPFVFITLPWLIKFYVTRHC